MASPKPSPLRKREGNQASSQTKDKAEVAKAYIERKYQKQIREEQERKEQWQDINRVLGDMRLSENQQEEIRQEVLHKEAEQLRTRRRRICVFDFDSIAIIGRGAFGEVRVVRHRPSGAILAMKKMNKSEMVYKNQVQHVRAERDVLARADNPWIVELKYSFQDEKYLYLVMEYLAGGDLMTLLMKKDILTEGEAKYYTAQMVASVESVHMMGYVHRDLKPDNILLDREGRIKISDFGLCKRADLATVPHPYDNRLRTDDSRPRNLQERLAQGQERTGQGPEFKRNRQQLFSTVGTPDYIAPEVFARTGYDETVDWWSVGVILYEMLVGYPPFFADDPSSTCQKILHWRKTFTIPKEAKLSPPASDLIRRLVTDPQDRLGRNGAQEIKSHPFFYGLDWSSIRNIEAPYRPEVRSDIDTSNFDKFEEKDAFYPEVTRRKKQRKDPNFVGYTYKQEDELQRPVLAAALQELEQLHSSTVRPRTQPKAPDSKDRLSHRTHTPD